MDGYIKWEDYSRAVDKRMGEDVMKGSKWMVDPLVWSRPPWLYQGQFDLEDGVVSTESCACILYWIICWPMREGFGKWIIFPNRFPFVALHELKIDI